MPQAGGQDTYRHDRDGWAVQTVDASHAAHINHTVAITDDGAIVLTNPRTARGAISVSFDEANLVPHAGLLAAAALAHRIDLAGLVNQRL